MRNVQNMKRHCLSPDCSKEAINSHLLQKNGVLRPLTVDGHLVEFGTLGIHQMSDDNFVKFKKIGINKALAQPLFCNNHDTGIFKSIETHPVDFSSYQSQILFSYRATCLELRKKMDAAILYERLLNARGLMGKINRDEIELAKDGFELGIKDLLNHKTLLEEEISRPSNSFHFSLFEYPLIEVYASALFSPIDRSIFNPYQKETFPSVFIHLVPYATKLYIILGVQKELSSDWIKNYIGEWQDLSHSQLTEKMTDLFATRIETWGMSPTLFEKLSSKTKTKFIEYWNINGNNLNVNQKVDFNLFQ